VVIIKIASADAAIAKVTGHIKSFSSIGDFVFKEPPSG
jgi:hypothetical protein